MSATNAVCHEQGLRKACEALNAPSQALHAAADGLAAALHAGSMDGEGVYYLLKAVAAQLDQAIRRVEQEALRQ